MKTTAASTLSANSRNKLPLANFKTFLYPAVRKLSIAARRKAMRYQAGAGDLEHLENLAAPPAGMPDQKQVERPSVA